MKSIWLLSCLLPFIWFSEEEPPDVYRIEIAARSDFYAIDRILLHKKDISQNDVLSQADDFSAKKSCD